MHSLELDIRLAPDDDTPWRRISIAADATLRHLHQAIQDVCGWDDSHLHAFIVPTRKYFHAGWTVAEIASERGIPDPQSVPMSVLLRAPGDHATYWYDFGDDWCHHVEVVGIRPGSEGRALLGGKFAFPPEDSGGMHSYMCSAELVRKARGKSLRAVEEDDQERLEWLGDWDPDRLDLETLASAFDRRVLPRGELVELPTARAILGGMRVPPAVSKRAAELREIAIAMVGPDDALSIVRRVGSVDVADRWVATVGEAIPRDYHGMSAFYVVLNAAWERLDELAFDEPIVAGDRALKLLEFLISSQEDICYDDDFDLHVEPLALDAVRWSMGGGKGIREIAPLFKRLVSIVEMDGHGNLGSLGDKLQKLRWNKAQKARIVRTLQEHGDSSSIPVALRTLVSAFEV